jgi:V/A-type H+-transporting ATPase subunit F
VKKILFITLPDAQYGFRLAGVEQIVAAPEEGAAKLLDATKDPAVGMIVVDERLTDKSVQKEIASLQRRWEGVIAVLPAPGKLPSSQEDYAMRLIREAVGYQVRVNV